MSSANGILSVIIAVVMLFSGMCGSVAKTGEPVSVEVGLTLEGDLSALIPAGETAAVEAEAAEEAVEAAAEDAAAEEAAPAEDPQAKLISEITSLVNALSIRFAADSSAAQLDIKLNGTSALALAGKEADGVWSVVSTLFPSSVVTVTKETLDSFMQASAGAGASNPLSSIDAEALAEAVKAPLEELSAYFEGAKGEPETGSWTVGGVEYTTKTAYNVTAKEAFTKILTAVKTILNDERLADIVALMGDEFDPATIDNALESLAEQDDDQIPILSAAEYANEAGDTCTELILSQNEQSLSLLIAVSGAVIKADLDIFGQLTAVLVLNEEAGQYTLEGNFTTDDGMPVAFAGELAVADAQSDFAFRVTVPVGETPITIGIKGTAAHDAPVINTESLKVLSLEAMMTEEGAEDAAAFNNELSTGVMQLLMGTLGAQYPTLIQSLMMSMQ